MLTRGYSSVNQLFFVIMVSVVTMLLVPLAVPGSAIFRVALVTAGFGAVYFWRGTRQEQQLAKRMFDDARRRQQHIHNSS